MATFTDVFERKEIKYRLSARQHRAMAAALAGHMTPDEFGCTNVVSIYFDTPDRSLIDRSLEKPLYKEKLRLRSYGMPEESDRVFVEIKKKFDGIVYKRRVSLSYAAARAYLSGAPYGMACAQHPLPDPVMAAESHAPHSVQIASEIDRFMVQHRPLRASMLISCQRTAYAELETLEALERGEAAEGLRITFDSDIAYRDLFASQVSNPRHLLGAGEAVMEVKSAGPFPLWLVKVLNECRAYPSSFSKYGEAYRACAAAAEESQPMRSRAVPGKGAERPAADDGIGLVRGRAATPRHAAQSACSANSGYSAHLVQPAYLEHSPCPEYSAQPAHLAQSVPCARSAYLASRTPRTPRAASSAFEEAGECLAVGARDEQHRRFRAPKHLATRG